MTDVFISYSHVDRESAEFVVDAFEKAGLRVDWDDHLRAGEPFERTISSRIASASQVVVLWSSNSRESTWVLREAKQARGLGIIAPAFLDECTPPEGFADLIAVDLSEVTPSDQRLADFVKAVESSARQSSVNTSDAGNDVRRAFDARNRGDFEGATRFLENAFVRFEVDEVAKEDRRKAERFRDETMRVLEAIASTEYCGRSMATLAGESLLPVIDMVLEVNLDILRTRGCKLQPKHEKRKYARAGVVIRPGAEVDDSRLIDKLLTETSSRKGPLALDCFLLIMRTSDAARGDEFSQLAMSRNLHAECIVWQPDDGNDKLEERLRATSEHLCIAVPAG